MTDTSMLFTRAAEYWNSVASDEDDPITWLIKAATVSGLLLSYESARVTQDGGDSPKDQYLQMLDRLLSVIEEHSDAQTATLAASLACLGMVSPYRPPASAAETERA